MIGELFALMAALSWAIGAIFDRVGLTKIPPLTANTMRSIPAAVFTLIITILIEGLNPLTNVTFTDIIYIIAGTTLALVIGDYFFLLSLRKLGVSKTMPIVSIYPIFALIGSALFLNESITLFIGVGVAATITGVFFISRSRNVEQSDSNSKFLLIIPVIAALMWGFSQVFFGLALLNTPPLTMTTIRLIYFSALLVTLNLTVGDRYFYRKYNSHWGRMSTIGGFLSLALGGLFLILGLSYAGVAKTSPLTSVTPMFSTILAVLLLKEKLELNTCIGTALIIVGIILIIF
ncbi:MAG: DMT family transporter [Candidatus Odinarchaeum yellowstonii]|uniref:DMT family transporter n=1 Tax=Odinarchaeota yellowstonii (strain LCB_4) TaxID=1841599 RepID=A0AAF0IB44_ODILC|nr:MAG: DMT family transporter [Candidatus Odinarchaeum yellowstonii]